MFVLKNMEIYKNNFIWNWKKLKKFKNCRFKKKIKIKK